MTRERVAVDEPLEIGLRRIQSLVLEPMRRTASARADGDAAQAEISSDEAVAAVHGTHLGM